MLGAAMLLSSIPAMTASAGNFSRVSVHDPSIVKLEEGGYYMIGSHLGAARSADLQNWQNAANSNLGSTRTTFFKDIYKDLAIPEKWSNTTNGYNLAGNMWAPDIIYNPKMRKYCMYLSVNGQVWNSSVVLCTSDKIDGPYTYQGSIVYSGFTNGSTNNVNDTDVPRVLGQNPDIGRYLSNGAWNASYGTNAIDPAVFYDESGNLHMVYGSWFGGIYMLELDEQTGLRDYNVKYETKANVSDAYMGKKVAGGNYVSGEGPYIEYMKAPGSDKGYYYLFVSYGFFNSNGGYNMRVFRSENPTGPYTDQNGNSAVFPRGGDNIGGTTGERLMSNYQWACNDRPFKAQGHNSALMDSDGKLYVVYHTKFDDAYGFHEVRVHQLIMNEDGWITAAPYEYAGESLAEKGHAAAAVTGEYDFIFHTLNQRFENEKSADVEKPKTISLNADGTVSGAVTGTWVMRGGSPYMSITFGGVTYKGAFLVQADESQAMTQRMTFTATGNNTCVWGSRKKAYDRASDVVNLTPVENGTYTVQNVNSNLYLHTNFAQSADQDRTAQNWTFTQTGDGWYTIQNAAGKALTVAGGSAEDGADIVLADLTGDTAQKFRVVQEGDVYAFLTAASGGVRAADVYNISTEPGANICQWEYWGGDGQKFRLLPAVKLKGDVNADGTADLADVIALHKFLMTDAATVADPEAADMTGDGRLNAADLTLLKRLLMQAQESQSAKQFASPAELMQAVRSNLIHVEPQSSTAENPGVKYGTYKRETIYSDVCKRNKSFNVLLPAGYTPEKKYPVLYVLHGYGGDEFTMTEMGDASLRIRFIVGNAIAAGEAEDMIVVFPDVYASATQDKCSGMDDANNAAYDNFINLLVKEIMPFMEKNYSIKTGPENTAITGGSMGGRESMYIGFKRPDLFGYIGAMCPAPGVAPGIISENDFRFNGQKPYLLMITGGTDDTVVYNTPGTYHDLLTKNGVDHVWHLVQGGDHVGRSIRPHMYTFVRYLFKG